MGDNEIPAHFIHEIEIKRYDVIGVSIFLRKLIKFLRKKRHAFGAPYPTHPCVLNLFNRQLKNTLQIKTLEDICATQMIDCFRKAYQNVR